MTAVILVIAVSAANLFCFAYGAKVAQSLQKGERVETPAEAVVSAMEINLERQEMKREQGRVDIIMENMENYDGTGNKQKDVPRW